MLFKCQLIIVLPKFTIFFLILKLGMSLNRLARIKTPNIKGFFIFLFFLSFVQMSSFDVHVILPLYSNTFKGIYYIQTVYIINNFKSQI